MKSLLQCFLLFACATLAFAAPSFPSELRLTSGVTLRKCEAVRWTNETVVVRHAGGVDPIRFANIAADQRKAVEAARPGPTMSDTAPTPPVASAKLKVAGQAFSKGFDQTYTFAGMRVRLFPLKAAKDATETSRINIAWPPAVAETTTDSEGRFSLEVPSGAYLLQARADRRHRNGSIATFEWRIDIEAEPDIGRLLLSDQNAVVSKVQ